MAETSTQKVSVNKDKLIIALDVETTAEAREIVDQLSGEVGAFKIGLQLFVSGGNLFVRELVEAGHKIFLDLKFHDIPNTVAKAAVEATRLGVWMFNVHALGGGEMMKRTLSEVQEVCLKEHLKQPLIIAVTILTSSNRETLKEVGIDSEIETEVLRLAKLTAECGLDGVVASPAETEIIRKSIVLGDFVIVTPGIRPSFATNDDQKRVMTPGDAVRNGSDHLVIGRPVTAAADCLAAVRKILGEMDQAF